MVRHGKTASKSALCEFQFKFTKMEKTRSKLVFCV